MKLRLDLLEHLTADDIRKAWSRFFNRAAFVKNWWGLSSASTEERAREVKHCTELTRKLEQRARQNGKSSGRCYDLASWICCGCFTLKPRSFFTMATRLPP
jgi:hypothetical protein